MSAPALEAGRELDALVAEKVMGDVAWDVVIAGCSRGGRRCETMTEAEQYRESLRAHYTVGDIVLHDSVPHYSTDIAAAWTVHLNMCDRLFSVRRRYLAEIQAQTGDCCLDSPSYVAWPDVLVVLRNEFPRAICRAALVACVPPSSPMGR